MHKWVCASIFPGIGNGAPKNMRHFPFIHLGLFLFCCKLQNDCGNNENKLHGNNNNNNNNYSQNKARQKRHALRAHKYATSCNKSHNSNCIPAKGGRGAEVTCMKRSCIACHWHSVSFWATRKWNSLRERKKTGRERKTKGNGSISTVKSCCMHWCCR